MSHYQQRVEKDCLNCGTLVEGRFCQHCGQENIVPKESFWGLLTHFVYDITHFDGKFFSTLKLLITKPGFLSQEYIRGKRAGYLHPIRMYVFSSGLFFLVFFTMFNSQSILKTDEAQADSRRVKLAEAIENLKKIERDTKDAVSKQVSANVLQHFEKNLMHMDSTILQSRIKDSLENLEEDRPSNTAAGLGSGANNTLKVRTTVGKKVLSQWEDSPGGWTGGGDVKYTSLLAYQEMQRQLPPGKKDPWLKNIVQSRLMAINEESVKKGGYESVKNIINNLIHSFPKLLFVSLPLFALILQILYFRRKDLYYSEHSIFAIHLYCATFVFLLLCFGLKELKDAMHWNIAGIIASLLFGWIYYYEYKSMRRFYGQSRTKTLLKLILLNVLSFSMMVLLLIIFMAISVNQQASASGH